jgi:uncharacterized protein (TIGR02145 family)
MITDIDGNSYQIVEIGNQVWMAENLKVTHYNNGDTIATELDDSAWITTTEGAYAIYDNDPANAEIYGNLYNWYAVNDDRGICPADYHVPSDEEFLSLSNYLGGDDIAGGKMKEIGIEHWNSPNTGATNESGFTGLPAGLRGSEGGYQRMGQGVYFWSSSESNISTNAWYHVLYYNHSLVWRMEYDQLSGYSIRCLADETTTGFRVGASCSCFICKTTNTIAGKLIVLHPPHK